MPSAMVASGGKRYWAVMLDSSQHGGQAFGLHTHDPDGGIALFQRAGYAADQSSAADGHHHSLKARNLAQQFQADSSLAIDHGMVVERMDKGHAFEGAEPHRFVASFIVVGSVQDDVGAKSTGGRSLHQRGH